jgi:hypothetical protein
LYKNRESTVGIDHNQVTFGKISNPIRCCTSNGRSINTESIERAEAISPIFEAVGGNLEPYSFEVGGSPGYIVAEMPDQESLGSVNMAILAGGAVTYSKAITIVTAEEAVEHCKKAASVTYRPPKG